MRDDRTRTGCSAVSVSVRVTTPYGRLDVGKRMNRVDLARNAEIIRVETYFSLSRCSDSYVCVGVIVCGFMQGPGNIPSVGSVPKAL